MKYLTQTHKESYTLVARKRYMKNLLRQHAFMAGTQKQQPGNAGSTGSVTHSPERLRGATHDLFELLERVQCSRLDDQRCVLPAYFSQVSWRLKTNIFA
ncbi:GH10583 [Drosophila grimshawi]|uniref:GH10583 n=1 Tax=Drosophila grimshawi TaxID=7222 RepID=B4JDB0_DROGR|nr:GH10583 [Drosophila grimshawi]